MPRTLDVEIHCVNKSDSFRQVEDFQMLHVGSDDNQQSLQSTQKWLVPVYTFNVLVKRIHRVLNSDTALTTNRWRAEKDMKTWKLLQSIDL